MKLGTRSITRNIKIKGQLIKVQANKNYGICDMEPKYDSIFTDFQGQQINDPQVFHNLINTLKQVVR